jgi:hypothetical protein
MARMFGVQTYQKAGQQSESLRSAHVNWSILPSHESRSGPGPVDRNVFRNVLGFLSPILSLINYRQEPLGRPGLATRSGVLKPTVTTRAGGAVIAARAGPGRSQMIRVRLGRGPDNHLVPRSYAGRCPDEASHVDRRGINHAIGHGLSAGPGYGPVKVLVWPPAPAPGRLRPQF